MWKAPRHRYYTDHSVDHSERLLVKIGQLAALLPAADPLNELEETVLAAAAYLHDIGMQYAKAPFSDADEARRKHHEISYDWIVNSVSPPMADHWPTLGLESLVDLADDIAVVAKGHRGVTLDGPEFESVLRGDHHIRRRLLATMLRLADALDMDRRRVIVDRLRTEDIPYESRLYWWKCYYVSGVGIGTDGTIDVQLRVPQADLPFEHQTVIQAAVEAEIARALAETEKLLWAHKIPLRYGESAAVPSPSVDAMPRADLLALWQRVERTWHSLPLPEPQYFAAWYRHLEHFPGELLKEADTLEDGNPFKAAHRRWQAMREYERLGFILKAVEQAERAARLCEDVGRLRAAFACFLRAGRMEQERGDSDRARAFFDDAARVAKARNASRHERIALCARDTAVVMMGAGVKALSAVRAGNLDDLPRWLRRDALYALAWAYANDLQWQEGADALLSAAEEDTSPGSLVPLLLDAAYMKARAGRIAEAKAQLDRCTALAEPLKDSVPDLWAKLLSRRAHISYLCDDTEAARQALEEAIEFADECGDVRGRVVSRRNLLSVSFPAGVLPMAQLADWSIAADIQARTLDDHERARAKEYYGLRAHRGGELPQALREYYASWRTHLALGNLVGVQDAENRIGQLMADIGDIARAVQYLANSGAVDELQELCECLQSSGNTQLIASVIRSCRELAVNVPSRVGLCAVVGHLWEYLTDDDVESLVETILPWTQGGSSISREHDLPTQAYRTLAFLGFRASDDTARRVCERCIHALQHDTTPALLEAQMRCLSFAAQNRTWADADVMRFLSALEKHATSNLVRERALASMAEMVSPGTKPMEHLRERLEAQAIQGDVTSANILVQTSIPIPDPAVLQPALSKYGEILQSYASVGPHDKISAGGPLIWMVGHYADYLSPDTLDEHTELLLRILTNPHQLLTHRQSAAEGLRLLAPVIPARRLREVWDCLLGIAFGTLRLEGVPAVLLGTRHPLSRGRVHAGTPEDVQMTSRWALARLAPRVDTRRRSKFCAQLTDGFFDVTNVIPVKGSVAAAGELYVHVAQAHRSALFLRVYSMLAHPHPPVIQTALEALRSMLPNLTKKEKREVVRRLRQLSTSSHPGTRIATLTVAEELLKQDEGQPAELMRLIEERQKDPCWGVRDMAQQVLKAVH